MIVLIVVFFEAPASDFNELNGNVTCCIIFCEALWAHQDLLCIQQQIMVHTNLGKLCQAKEKAYRSGDWALFKQARNKLTKEIRGG